MKRDNKQNLSEAYQFFDSSFGYVVPFEKIQADPDSYASVFCEGSVALRNLLYDLWQNGVETRGCCKGHECVHYYVKDSLFGGQKYIDEQAYKAHAKSRRYRDIETEGHAYLAFRPDIFGEAKQVCDRIENRMKELLPDLSYATNAFPDLVTIGLSKYVERPQREAFFSALSSVMYTEFLQEKITENSNRVSGKPSLDSKIQCALSKAELSALKMNFLSRAESPER